MYLPFTTLFTVHYPVPPLLAGDGHGRGAPEAYTVDGNETQGVLERVFSVHREPFPTHFTYNLLMYNMVTYCQRLHLKTKRL